MKTQYHKKYDDVYIERGFCTVIYRRHYSMESDACLVEIESIECIHDELVSVFLKGASLQNVFAYFCNLAYKQPTLYLQNHARRDVNMIDVIHHVADRFLSCPIKFGLTRRGLAFLKCEPGYIFPYHEMDKTQRGLVMLVVRNELRSSPLKTACVACNDCLAVRDEGGLCKHINPSELITDLCKAIMSDSKDYFKATSENCQLQNVMARRICDVLIQKLNTNHLISRREICDIYSFTSMSCT